MWQGDSLNVVLWLGGLTIGSAIAAVGAPSGWRSTLLAWVAVVFFLATLSWIAAPAASPVILAITPVAVAIAKSNAFFMVAVISFVAMMVGGRSPPAQPREGTPASSKEVVSLPAFAVSPTTKWSPDINFRKGLVYLGKGSIWRSEYGNTVEAATAALIAALESNKITAWGREHPDEGEMHQIAQKFWMRADVTLDTDYAFSQRLSVGAYDVHLCQKEMEHVWPPKGEA